MADASREPAPGLPSYATGVALGFLFGLLAKDLGFRGLVSYWASFAPLVLVSALLGAILWATRLRWLLVTLTAMTSLLWVAVAFTPLAAVMVRPLLRSDPPAKADAIYVLAANVQPDDEPSAASMTRALRGLELLGQKLAPRLLVSEIGAPAGSYLSYLRKDAAKLGGFDEKSIESIGFVVNTHDEALRVAAFFRERGYKRLLLVSSPTHMRRAAAVFEHAGVPVVIAVPAIETETDLERLDLADDRILAFRVALHEWVGLLVYRLRGWTVGLGTGTSAR
jgi:uncharacterized SAM-binding protein YcdF (DUF218 family)